MELVLCMDFFHQSGILTSYILSCSDLAYGAWELREVNGLLVLGFELVVNLDCWKQEIQHNQRLKGLNSNWYTWISFQEALTRLLNWVLSVSLPVESGSRQLLCPSWQSFLASCLICSFALTSSMVPRLSHHPYWELSRYTILIKS